MLGLVIPAASAPQAPPCRRRWHPSRRRTPDTVSLASHEPAPAFAQAPAEPSAQQARPVLLALRASVGAAAELPLRFCFFAATAVPCRLRHDGPGRPRDPEQAQHREGVASVSGALVGLRLPPSQVWSPAVLSR